MKKFFSLLLTGVMSVMLLAGCGNTANDSSPASSSTPSAGAEERSITIAQSANFSMGFAPGVQSYEATYYMNNFYEGLVEYRDGEYLPCLATDWVSSDDGLTYTFHLRENVQFNDGTPFNAEAVKLYFDNMKSVIGTSANYGQFDGCRNRLFCITYAKQTREKFLFHSAFSEKPCITQRKGKGNQKTSENLRPFCLAPC